jgi:hypothetical protein
MSSERSVEETEVTNLYFAEYMLTFACQMEAKYWGEVFDSKVGQGLLFYA